MRWRDKGIGEKLLEKWVDSADFEGLMIDGSDAKVHRHAGGGKGRKQEMRRSKRGTIRR